MKLDPNLISAFHSRTFLSLLLYLIRDCLKHVLKALLFVYNHFLLVNVQFMSIYKTVSFSNGLCIPETQFLILFLLDHRNLFRDHHN